MDKLLDARRLDIEELRELMVQQRRFVLERYEGRACRVTEQTLIQPCRISGTELMVVGLGDKNYGRYLVAAASDYDVVLKELLAKHEAARNDDGLRADVGVAAAGCQDETRRELLEVGTEVPCSDRKAELEVASEEN